MSELELSSFYPVVSIAELVEPLEVQDGIRVDLRWWFVFLNFYWSIVDFKCCLSSCCTAK